MNENSIFGIFAICLAAVAITLITNININSIVAMKIENKSVAAGKK